MNRNVVMIVVDAFFYDYIGKKDFKNTSTPFLDKLSKNKNCVSIKKMFSEAPYTEAALMSLLGGCDTMDNGAYMKRLKKSNCLLEEFKKNGYTVFANCFQSSIFPSGALTGVNELYYNSSFSFVASWSYRIKHFAELYKSKGLTTEQFGLIYDILIDNFEEAIKFLKYLNNNDKKTEILYDKLDLTHVESDLNFVMDEYKKFKLDSKKYVLELFEQGAEHPINKLYTYPITEKIKDIDTLKKIQHKYKPTIRRIFNKNFKYNLFNNRISLKKVFNLLRVNDFHNLKLYLKNYISSIIDKDLFDRINHETYNKVKTIPSAYTHFEHFKKWYKDFDKKSNFFAYLHVDDIHFREMFFSHDVVDFDLLDDEFNYINEYIDKIPKNYKGSLAYDLGVLYIDKKIENLYNFLKKEKLLDNTDVIITADHGNSYSYNPIRENFVINFYRENYQIPCLIYSNNCSFSVNNNNYYQTKDIAATILSMHKISIPKSYTGTSLLNFDGRDYVIAQYAGSGCPDIVNRPIQLNVRTKKYSVCGEINLLDKTSFKLKEVYDLINDSKESINLIYTKKNFDISYEMEIINQQINNLNKTNKKILCEKRDKYED